MTTPTVAVVRIDSLPAVVWLREPLPGAPGIEGDLAIANERQRIESTGRLERLLGSEGLAAIAAPGAPRICVQSWHQERSQPVQALTSIDALIAARRPGVSTGHRPSLHLDDPGWGRAGAVAAELRGTVTLQYPDAGFAVPGLSAAADDLACALRCRVDVAVFAAGADAEPVGRFEAHDHLVIPLGGPIRVAGLPLPIPPGQAAVVPAGAPLAIDAPGSWWVEIELQRFGPTEIESFVAEHCFEIAAFRESIPWDPLAPLEQADSMFGRPDALQWAISQIDVPAMERNANANFHALTRPLRPLSINPEDPPVLQHEGLAIAAPGGWLMVERVVERDLLNDETSVAVAVAGRMIQAPPILIQRIAAGDLPPDLVPALATADLLRLPPAYLEDPPPPDRS